MKFGLRVPSLKKRISARTSLKRYARHSLGIKMPRGTGFITNPKKALYNKIYNKTSFSIGSLVSGGKINSQTPTMLFQGGNVSKIILPIIIFIFLLLVAWPLGVAYILYKIAKLYFRNKRQPVVNSPEANNALVALENDKHLSSSFQIPEPTKSLIFITDEDLSKMKNPMSITINVSLDLDEQKVNTTYDDNKASLYAEPSLIWKRLPIKENNELEIKPMYYPSYAGLLPEQRYQYINWLRDVEQETNLSYVFLYYYGLERHLLVGNYDAAVDEILRLIKFHGKGSFKSYATTALIAASIFRKRPDILEKAPFILDDVSNISLYLRFELQKELSAKDLIELANRVKFYNKRYIKSKPDLFEKILQEIVNNYHDKYGFILSQSEDFAFDDQIYFANLSIPDKIRSIKTPQIIENNKFRQTVYDLLNQAHLRIKELNSKKTDTVINI